MKIVVLGITGRLGKRIGRLLFERGHEVVGANRRPERVPIVIPDLPVETVVVDTSDSKPLLALIRGADLVVLATAPTRENPKAYPGHTANVINAVKIAAVPRLVALSNHMALRAPDGRPMLEAEPPHQYFRDIESVYVTEADLFRQERELDWLLVAPPADLYPYGEVSGQYRVQQDVLVTTDPTNTAFKQVSTLSMEDFAAFVADEIENPTYSRALITLAY